LIVAELAFLVGSVADSVSMTELRIIQDNKEHRMSAGNSIPVEFRDKRCVLKLLSLQWESPASDDFAWSCKHKRDGGISCEKALGAEHWRTSLHSHFMEIKSLPRAKEGR
jgi:hypothetical protein